MKAPSRALALRGAGSVLLLLFLWRLGVDIGEVRDALGDASTVPLLLSLAGIVPIVGVKAWRWRWIAGRLGVDLDRREALALYSLGLGAGAFTPGQAGDLIKAWRARDGGHELTPVLVATVLDRLFDLVVVLVLAGIGLALLGLELAGRLPVLVVGLAGAGAVAVGIASPPVRARITRFLRPTGAGDESPPRLAPPDHALPLALTVVTAAMAAARFGFAARCLGIDLSPVEVVSVSSLVTVAGLVPVSIAGIGVRDLTLSRLLRPLGHGVADAVALAALLLLHNVVNLVAGWGAWWALRPARYRHGPTGDGAAPGA